MFKEIVIYVFRKWIILLGLFAVFGVLFKAVWLVLLCVFGGVLYAVLYWMD
jgi:hypothetical protein